MEALYGHTDEESAYVVADYPYGFRLRTQIRYWIETKRGQGQRLMAQTMNPKTGRWNKAKASTYSNVKAMYLADNGHVETFSLGGFDKEETIARFEESFPELVETDFYTIEAIRYLRAGIRAAAHYTVSVHVCGSACTDPDCDKKRQTPKEQQEIIGKAIRYELWQDTRAAIRGE